MINYNDNIYVLWTKYFGKSLQEKSNKLAGSCVVV